MRTAIFALISLYCVSSLPAQTRPGWTLTWSDEFNGSAIDASKWTYNTGGDGWGNNELEYYTNRPANAYLENGVLVIKAIREPFGNREYTSARLLTQGKFTQTYGRFEARMKLPYGQGIWPAFWMLGEDISTKGWPACGEIDIMENIGKEPFTVHGTIHGPGYFGGNGIGGAYSLPGGAKFSDDFHVYAVEWEPAALRFYVDDQLYKTATPADLPAGAKWVYDHPFFLLLNLAVGGNWPGNPDSSTRFPQLLTVDYVRVYRQSGKPAVGSGAVVNGASFEPGITPGSWATVAGTDLASTKREWGAEDFAGGALPSQLDGVSVTVNGKPASIHYISPTQINFQVPDIAAGPATIQVSNNGQASEPVQVDVRAFHPALFLWQTKYAVATRTDFSLVGKPGLFPGVNTTPAKPGDVIILWGTGFGPTEPAVPAGQLVSGTNRLLTDPVVRIAGTPARYFGGALTSGFAGLYQIAVQVPESTPDGDVPVVAEMAGVTSPAAVFLTVAAN